MYFSSNYISQTISGQNAGFAQNNYLAQQMALPAAPGMMPGQGQMMAPPPPVQMPQPIGLKQQFMSNQGGMMGESAAARIGSFGTNVAMPLGVGLGTMAMGIDPFSLALKGGRMGFAAGGMTGAAMGAMGAALPMYAATQMASSYGNAFMGGITDQAATNSTLRNNFTFLGGSRGRGFTQQQMGTIGGLIQDQANNDIFTSTNELNSLVAQGAQSGMFNGVRDVGEFSRKFRQMISTLKDVQKELGGSLQEAMTFVNEAKQSGIYSRLDRTNFASEIRSLTQSTGLSQGQAMGLANQGAQVARQFGAYGSQGAFGALRQANQLGAAVNSGAIDMGMLSEATGGLTGSDALSAFASRMLEHTGRFSRRSAGRFMMYSMADPSGGIDEAALDRLRSGDITRSSVMRGAYGRASQMGRAQAMNREGELRGALMERGGLSGQIGMARLMLGANVENMDDDRAQLLIRRRLGMSRPEAQIFQQLMRNQDGIAIQETMDRGASRRQEERAGIERDRSFGSVMNRMGRAVEEGLQLDDVRRAGRRFATTLSSATERVMDQMLGTYKQEMTNATRESLNRITTGRGTDSDYRRMQMLDEVGGTGTSVDLYSQGLLQRLSGGTSAGETLDMMGFGRTRAGMRGRASESQQERLAQAQRDMFEARRGRMDSASDQARFESLAGSDEARSMILRAMTAGRGATPEAVAALRRQGGGMSGQLAVGLMGREGIDVTTTSLSAMGIRTGDQGGLFGDIFSDTSYDQAVRLVASGGASRQRMQMQADGSREESRRGLNGPGRFLRALGVDPNGREAEADAIARAAENMQVSEEAMAAVTQRGEVNRLLIDATSGDERVAARAVSQLEAMGTATTGSSEEDQALRTLALNVREEFDEVGARGMKNSPTRSLAAGPRAAEDARARSQERAMRTRDMQNMASEMAGSALGGTLNTFATDMSRESFTKLRQLYMQGSDEDRNSFMEAAVASGSEENRALAMSLASSRRRIEGMTGRNRFGVRGNVEAAANNLGGIGSGGDFEVSLNGRRLNARQARRLRDRFLSDPQSLSEEQRQAVVGAFREETSGMDLTSDQRREIVGAMQGVAQADTPEARRAAAERVEELRGRYSEQFQKADERRLDQLRQRQARQNPLDGERNRLLTEIVRRLPENSEGESSGAAAGTEGES